MYVLSAGALFAQPKLQPAAPLSAEAAERMHLQEDTLALLAYAVVNDSIEQERFAACRALITGLVRALKEENSFKYPFDRLKSISILAPPDSSFRIFTWQLFVNDSTYRYYGAIQLNQRELKLYPLVDRSFEMEDPFLVYEQHSPERWYGALYYNLRAYSTRQGKKYYLLFGFDCPSFFERRKLIDVLSFDAAGKPVFGAPVFEGYPTPKGAPGPEQRLLLEYSAEASVRLNWDENYQMILFDHLIPMPSPFGRGVTYVPDGSYEGFKFEKGRWIYVEKVFNDVMEETPRPEPILDSRKNKDIMGKSPRKKN